MLLWWLLAANGRTITKTGCCIKKEGGLQAPSQASRDNLKIN
jgi:hypothetical protein